MKLQAKKMGGSRVHLLAGMIDLHYQGEIGLLLYNTGKEDYACNPEDY